MNAHEQFADDLALYALDILEGEERKALETHLEGCAECGRELERLRGDMALMALSSAASAPPQRARQRLMAALEREPRRAPARQGWLTLVPWFAAAALALGLIAVWLQNVDLKRQMVGLQREAGQQTAELERAREIVSTLTTSEAMRVTLVVAKTAPQPQGKAFYLRDRSSLIFLASNLRPLPASKAYELWLIPTTGAPIPAGVFTPDQHGSATVINPPLPAGVTAKAFAITVEPENGSPAPTTPILMMGAGE